MLFLSHSQLKANTTLIVQKTDGTTESFQLADQPVVTFEGANGIFATSSLSISIPRADIDNFHFESVATGIKMVTPSTKDIANVRVRFIDGNTVEIAGQANSAVAVYRIDGAAANADVVKGADSATVSLGNLPKGIYVIKYGNNSIKMIRK